MAYEDARPTRQDYRTFLETNLKEDEREALCAELVAKHIRQTSVMTKLPPTTKTIQSQLTWFRSALPEGILTATLNLVESPDDIPGFADAWKLDPAAQENAYLASGTMKKNFV